VGLRVGAGGRGRLEKSGGRGRIVEK